MVSYTDNPPPGSIDTIDQNGDKDNYWVFTSDVEVDADNNLREAGELDGYSFKPVEHYNTDVTLRDGDNDGTITARHVQGAHTNDGFAIRSETDGVDYIYEVSRHWTVPVTVTYKDGSDPVTVEMRVSRLVDDPDNNQPAGPLHSKLIFRFADGDIPTVSKNGEYGLNEIEKITFNPENPESNFAGLRIDNYNEAFPAICFCTGTLLDGPSGQIAVENLNAGDLLQTVDHGCKPIRWIGTRHLDKAELAKSPNLRPIRITAGALGNNIPKQTLMVSPQHRVVIQSHWARELFGSDEVLVPAKKLLSLPGVEIADDVENVTYYHVLLDDHEILLSNGAMTESLYLGEQSLKSLTVEGRNEIMRLFPELQNGPSTMNPGRMIVHRNRDVEQLLSNMAVAARQSA